ncbi:RNA-directed DNA polymerase [Tanacetum coccineum]
MACKRISYLETPSRKVGLKNPTLSATNAENPTRPRNAVRTTQPRRSFQRKGDSRSQEREKQDDSLTNGHRMMLKRLAGHEYYCFLHGFLGYFHILITPEDQEKTMFTYPYDTFAYKRRPFGLCDALATFQRCMTAIFHELIEDSMEVFMDDFSIFSSSFDHCLKNLERMLKRCEETNLVLNWEKCHFMVKEGIVFGHKVSG